MWRSGGHSSSTGARQRPVRFPYSHRTQTTKWLFNGGVVPASGSAVDLVDGEVRELIRRGGLDPFTDPGPVRGLVRDVVADYAERSLSSALPPIGDPDGVARDVLDRVAGYGPLQRWLDDPEVEEIWVNKPTIRFSQLNDLLRVLSPH